MDFSSFRRVRFRLVLASSEDGCHRYDYYYSEADANELLLIEAWETKAHQVIHLEQPHMDKLRSFKGEYIETTTIGEFKVV